MSKRLQDKIAIITGAGQGIGAATAQVFAEQGANLVMADRAFSHVERHAENLQKKYGVRCIATNTDVSNPDDAKNMVIDAIKNFNRVDILINNAGIGIHREPHKLTDAEWRECFGVDLDGLWYCTREVLPHMLEQSYGHIVNIASVHGHKIIPHCFPYPVAKHGVVGITRALGIEYAAKGIRVNSISPGLIMTDGTKQGIIDRGAEGQAHKKRQEDILPCKRIGEPVEVANTALFLASDEARFINATDILIDGGRSQLYHE